MRGIEPAGGGAIMMAAPADGGDGGGGAKAAEQTEFDVERGYIWTSCASVENGNPLFWDDAVAQQITCGPIAPPTMLSVWFRPHYWAPGRTRVAQRRRGETAPSVDVDVDV